MNGVSVVGMMKAKSLREKPTEELQREYNQLVEALFNLHSQAKMGQINDPSLFKKTRRDIARILTILHERRLDKEKTPS